MTYFVYVFVFTFSSLAASAPIWTFREDAECDAFDRTVTETFRKSSSVCVDNIKALWRTVNTTASQGKFAFHFIILHIELFQPYHGLSEFCVIQLFDALPLNSHCM